MGERRLFAAIIMQAVRDAVGNGVTGNNKGDAYIQRSAMAWIVNNNNYFRMVCEYADISPDYVRLQVLNMAHDNRSIPKLRRR